MGDGKTDGPVIKKPPVYFDNRRASELMLDYEATPRLMHQFGGDLDALIYHMRQQSQHALREIQRAQQKRPPLGAQKLRRMHPYDEPRTLADGGGQRVPTFRIGARGFFGKEMHIRACMETTAFRETHAECRAEPLRGHDVAFPHGTYGMRVFHAAPVSDPDPEALLAHPGPLLHEVMDELERSPAPPQSDRDEMLGEVRSAFADEAAAIVEHEELNYRKPTRRTRPSSTRISAPPWRRSTAANRAGTGA